MRRAIFEPGPRRQDAADLNALNRRAVLAAIAKNPGISAAEAGRLTGLSPTSIHRIIPQLLERQLVEEGDQIRGQRGSPATALRINPDGAFSLGCQIGFGPCHMILRSLGGRVLATRDFEVGGGDLASVVDAILASHQSLAAELSEAHQARFVGAGIAVPADFSRLFGGLSRGEGTAAHWNERHLHSALNGRLPGALQTVSTGNAGAWAELAATPPPRPADLVYLYLDLFVQSGLLLDGRLWAGPSAVSGALGRCMVNSDQHPSRLYDVVAGLAPTASLTDSETEVWLDRTSAALVGPLHNWTAMVDVHRVVIEGNLPPGLLDRLVERVDVRLQGLAWVEPPQVSRGLAGERAPAKGAALLPLYHSLFSDELSASGR